MYVHRAMLLVKDEVQLFLSVRFRATLTSSFVHQSSTATERCGGSEDPVIAIVPAEPVSFGALIRSYNEEQASHAAVKEHA